MIIGNSVPVCYAEVQKLLPSEGGSQQTTEKKPFRLKNWGASILDTVSGSMAPLIPLLLGCGIVKLLLLLLDMFGISSELPAYQILTIIGDAGYYFLPLLVAFSASKKMRCSTPLAMTIVGVLLHPSLSAMLSGGNTSFLMIPVTSASYASTVIPALLSVWLLSKMEPIADRLLTEWRRSLLKPMLLFLVCVPISLIALAPPGMLIGNGMAAVLSFMYSKASLLTIGLYAAVLPLVVWPVCTLLCFPPYILSNLDTLGYDYLQLPAMLAYNLGQAAAALAVALKTKNKDLKATATTAAISAGIGGVTEPALYGVTLRLRKPLIASMIASGVTGVFIGFVGLKAFAFSGPCLVSFPMFASTEYAQNFVMACVAAVISVVLTFVLVWFMGWDDPVEEAETVTSTAAAAPAKPVAPEMHIASPVTGKVVPLDQVKDETFAQKILGDGVAIVPEKGEIVAPFDGTVGTVIDTGHALGISDASGQVELLIHVGMDTVNLNGEGFPLGSGGSFIQKRRRSAEVRPGCNQEEGV